MKHLTAHLPLTQPIKDFATENGSFTMFQTTVGEYLEILGLYDPRLGTAGWDSSLVTVHFQRAILTDRQPTLTNGELTPSGKIVRKAVITNHREALDGLFASHPNDRVIQIQSEQLQKA